MLAVIGEDNSLCYLDLRITFSSREFVQPLGYLHAGRIVRGHRLYVSGGHLEL